MLVSSTALALLSSAATTQASKAAGIEDVVNDSFQTAMYAADSEESLNRKYRLEPSAGVAAAHAASATSLVAALGRAHALGDAADRAAVDSVLRDQARYLTGSAKMYAAVDRGDRRLELTLDHTIVDPAFHRIERAVRDRALVHAVRADATLLHLRRTQEQNVRVALILAPLGLIALGVFLFVLLMYQRQLKALQQAKIKRLEGAALVDDLTGIGNRRAFKVDLDREVSRAQRYGETLTLAILDIDDFKILNDRNGHMHGDGVLAQVAALLASLRSEDRAYRIGGDEFAAILPHTTADMGSETLQRLRSEIQSRIVGCTVSVGLATLTGPNCHAAALQAQADAAMYAGKRAGPNGVTLFDASADGMWALSPNKIHGLEQLIDAGSMDVVFQPIWDVNEVRIVAYEALARPDPTYGFGGPLEMFNLAERIGRAHDLDAICRQSALEAAKQLPVDALLFLNVAPQSLIHDRLDPADFARAVRAVGLTPDRVVIEITQQSITPFEAVDATARALKKHGFRLGLDDTGGSTSGLDMLSRLPLDFVKIERDVIVNAIDDAGARAVLAGIVAIAATTGAYVIAEGVENAEMLKFVCQSGVRARPAASRHLIHGVQGYFLRTPSAVFPESVETDDVKAVFAACVADEAAHPSDPVALSTAPLRA